MPRAPREELTGDGRDDARGNCRTERDLRRTERHREPEQRGVAQKGEGGQKVVESRHAGRTIL